MGTRLQLQVILEGFLIPHSEPENRVHFQPPSNIEMNYPCIIYELDDADTQFADNVPYIYTERYAVTVIDPDPDSVIKRKVAALPMSRFNRFFVADNLNHFVYNIYF